MEFLSPTRRRSSWRNVLSSEGKGETTVFAGYSPVKLWFSIKLIATEPFSTLSCWIFENVPNENCGLLTEKKTKSRRQNKPENPARKERRKFTLLLCKPPVILGFLEWSMGFLCKSQPCLIFILFEKKKLFVFNVFITEN